MGRFPVQLPLSPARTGLACALLFVSLLNGCVAAKRLGTAAGMEAAIVTGDGNTTTTENSIDPYIEFMSDTRTRVDEVKGDMIVNNYETAKKATFWALLGRYGLKALETCFVGLWLKGKKPIKTENGIVTTKHVPRVPSRIED